MDSELEVWVSIAKPKISVGIVVADFPYPWVEAFRRRDGNLPCCGLAKTGRPCRRSVIRWSLFRQHHAEFVPSLCPAHRTEDHLALWDYSTDARSLTCPCGCGAETSTATGVLVPEFLHTQAHALWIDVLLALGPDQWRTESSNWRVTQRRTALMWDPREAIPYPTREALQWLFEGPRDFWDAYDE